MRFKPTDGDPLAIIASDERPIGVETRDVLLAAMRKVAAEHDGLVHISWLREALPAWCVWQGLGAFISARVSQGVLVSTGRYLPSGNAKQRNSSRPHLVYRFHPEAVQA